MYVPVTNSQPNDGGSGDGGSDSTGDTGGGSTDGSGGIGSGNGSGTGTGGSGGGNSGGTGGGGSGSNDPLVALALDRQWCGTASLHLSNQNTTTIFFPTVVLTDQEGRMVDQRAFGTMAANQTESLVFRSLAAGNFNLKVSYEVNLGISQTFDFPLEVPPQDPMQCSNVGKKDIHLVALEIHEGFISKSLRKLFGENRHKPGVWKQLYEALNRVFPTDDRVLVDLELKSIQFGTDSYHPLIRLPIEVKASRGGQVVYQETQVLFIPETGEEASVTETLEIPNFALDNGSEVMVTAIPRNDEAMVGNNQVSIHIQ